TGIVVDDIIACFDHRKYDKENDVLTPRDDDYFFGCCVYPARLTHVLSDGLTQLRQAGRRPVVGEALVQRVTSCVDDIAGRIEIRFSDLEMDDVAALCLERSCFNQYFEGGFSAETRHALGEAEFALCGFIHHSGIKIMLGGNVSLNPQPLKLNFLDDGEMSIIA